MSISIYTRKPRIMFDPLIPNNNLQLLPSDFDYNQKELLKAAIKANNALAKLNGLSRLIPNADLLIAPLLIKESVDSNAIENINTTTLKVLQAEAVEKILSGPEKEVVHYRKALLQGIEQIAHYHGIPTHLLIELQAILEPSKSGIRKIPVAIRKGDAIIYTPPEGEYLIKNFLSNLEQFVNDHHDDIDPLIKIAVLHYQFESIHPFSDGNGRTGRILMILYLILTQKLDYPILFLSAYINQSRSQYYTLLNQTNQNNDYTAFILYILQGIEEQSLQTQKKIIAMQNLMTTIQSSIQVQSSLDYHKITQILFSFPFISIGNFQAKIGVTKPTVSKYIHILEDLHIIKTIKVGRNSLIYIPDFIVLLS